MRINHHRLLWPRQEAPAPSASAVGRDGVVSTDDLINQAERHFNVSGTSVLAAWGLTLVAGILIVTLYSLSRRKALHRQAAAMLWLPRINHSESKLKAFRKSHADQRLAVNKEKEDKGEEKYRGLLPPKVAMTGKDEFLFTWLATQFPMFWKELWQPFRGKSLEKDDQERLKLVGMDAMTYIQYLRMLRWLFACLTFFVAIPLALANYYLNSGGTISETSSAKDVASTAANQVANQNASSILDNLQLFTAAGIDGNALWVHIGFEWIISSLVLGFVTGHSWYHGQLLHFWVDQNQANIAFRSLMITNFRIEENRLKGKPGPVSIKRAKDRICEMLGIPERERENTSSEKNKDGTPKCTVVLNHKMLEDLSRNIAIVKRKHYPKFERTLFTYVEQWKDPTRHRYASCLHRLRGKTKTEKELAEQFNETAKSLNEDETKIALHQEKAKQLIESQGHQQIESVITSAFVTFESSKRAYEVLASEALRIQRDKEPEDFRVDRAPRPDNIVWKNLSYDKQARRSHTFSGYLALAVIFVIYTVPLMAITVLTNVDTLANSIPFLKSFRDTNDFTQLVFTGLAGIIPPSISALAAYILPYVIRWLDKWSGALSRGELDKHVVKCLFAFQLFSSFVVFSLFGIIWETYLTVRDQINTKTWSEIFDELGDVPTQITKVYISESSYWLSWYPIRCAVVLLQLMQLPRVILKIWQLMTSDEQRPTQLREIAQPRNFELFAMGVAIIYTPLAPLVVIAATLVFWVYSIVHYNQILYVEDFKETDGKSWQVIKIRVLAATVLMQLLMTLTIALKTESPTMTTTAFVPISFVLGFHYIDQKTNYFSRQVNPKLLVDAGYGRGKPIPYFKHELLDDSWKPDLHWVPTDKAIIQEITEKNVWAQRLFRKKKTQGDIETGTAKRSEKAKFGHSKRKGRR